MDCWVRRRKRSTVERNGTDGAGGRARGKAEELADKYTIRRTDRAIKRRVEKMGMRRIKFHGMKVCNQI